jgi:hypothetical protein
VAGSGESKASGRTATAWHITMGLKDFGLKMKTYEELKSIIQEMTKDQARLIFYILLTRIKNDALEQSDLEQAIEISLTGEKDVR